MKTTLLLGLLTILPLCADDDTFRERFADPATRDASLAELIPGTRDAFFHTALAHQLAGREADFQATLAAWRLAAERKTDPVPLTGIKVLENRQLLLDYQKSPDASLAELIKRLNLDFSAAQPNAAAAETLPTRLDPALVGVAAFEAAAAKKSPQQPYTAYSGQRLYREVLDFPNFDETKTRWFLQALRRADLPGVVDLVNRGLSLEPPVAFSRETVHGLLTAEQLAALLELHPGLINNEAFATAYLAKLRPGVETDFDRDPAAHADYLAKCRDFVLRLTPALNSLKGHVLYHHLRLQAEQNRFPKEDFLAYLALPRSSHALLKTNEKDSVRFPVDPNRICEDATGCPPVGDDRELIELYLNHFLSEADKPAEFAPYVPDAVLTVMHARARLLAGADPARWAAALDPAAFRELQEETRIRYTRQRPGRLDSAARVAFDLDLKHTPDLLVRIYEIDLPAHLASHQSDPEADLDIEGMVPHHQRRLTFDQAPLVSHRERIEMPELAGPGAWLVEFVSGRVSARALVRKGDLTLYQERTATAQTIRVFDETGNPVPSAVLTLGSERLTADAAGVITVPDSSLKPLRSGVVAAGKLAARVDLGSREDDLALDAKFHLDREQLLADQETRLQLRVRLTNHGCELPLDRLKTPSLVLRGELSGGITTERVIAEDLALKPAMEIPFQVPADLRKLTLSLRATVVPPTGSEPVSLSGEATYQLNGDLARSNIGTVFFSPTATGHRLELRGRNGEPIPSHALTVTAARSDYDIEIKTTVRTDAQGCVELGTLDTIDLLTVSDGPEDAKPGGSGINTASYEPRAVSFFPPTDLHLTPESVVRLPLLRATAPDRMVHSLLETRDDRPIHDWFSCLAAENGQLVLRGLPPGDFKLTLEDDNEIDIRVTAGVPREKLLVSPTRILPAFAPLQPSIESATAADGSLTVKFRDLDPATRISLVGKRHLHGDWTPGGALYPFPNPLPSVLARGFSTCGYLTNRLLDDETRYILDRRAAKTFPGSMLPRPGLLLNRWDNETAQQNNLTGQGAAVGALDSAGAAAFGTSERKSKPRSETGKENHAAICDFLSQGAVVRFDLDPPADGVLKLPLADFKDCQFIEITASSPDADFNRTVPLPPCDTPLRDRRLARPLDPKLHFQATRRAAYLAKGATATIENLLDADWRAFTTLADAHQLLFGMKPDDRLGKFVFLTEWPDLTETRKLELLAEHPCNELHLFLARKDPEFFNKFVRPMLERKPEPTVIDDILLGRDLSDHLRPFAWQRLNAAEKALIALAVPTARERIHRELKLRWELEAPNPEQETRLFTQTLRGTSLDVTDSLGLARKELQSREEEGMMASAGISYINEKLHRIVIPNVNFKDITLDEAIEFLRIRAKECDSTEPDPTRKGINILMRNIESPTPVIKSLQLSNIPIGQVLKYICDATKTRYKTDDFAVSVIPATDCADENFTRTFRVPPNFYGTLLANLRGGDNQENDPFADAGAARPGITARMSVADALKLCGVSFPAGTSVALTPSGLLVTNSALEMDKIQTLIKAVSNPSADAGRSHDGFSDGDRDSFDTSILPPLDAGGDSAADPFCAPELPNSVGGTGRRLASPAPAVTHALRVSPDRTRVWREANYYRHSGATDETLIPLNRFWLDLASWDGKGPFLSPHFNACATTANEALMCLALLDLPFKAGRPEVVVDGNRLRVKAREPMLLFYRDTRPADKVAPESPLLVRQTFCPLGEPFRTVAGERVENPVTGDFRPGVPYTMALTITNPTGIGRRVEVLAQIPAGSIPLGGKSATLSEARQLEPYGVLNLELACYFPAAGEFATYPLHVSSDDTVLAHTATRVIRVSNKPEPRDAATWSVLAAEGTTQAVLERLRTENLGTIDLSEIRWRLKDREVFLKVAAILRERMHHSPAVAAYGFLHNDPQSMRDYLENSTAVTQLGQWLDSPLLTVRPRPHHDWRTLEFDPVVNPRAHRFTAASRLTHEAAREHYHAFLDQLAWKPALDAADQLTLTAFLLLQDRVAEALARFDRIDPKKLASRMHYDYLQAVVLCYREQPDAARAIALTTVPKLPPGLWRERFQAVIDQTAEIAELTGDAAAAKPAPAAPAEPRIELAMDGSNKIRIAHRGVDEADLRIFGVDLEMLFTKDPFLTGDTGGPPAIRPNRILTVPLAKDGSGTTIELPPDLPPGNLLIDARAGGAKQLKVLDSAALDIRRFAADRTLQVLDAASHRPLPKTYVKVYVRTASGETVFHKDGYTDLRGKFDYLTHTATDPSTIQQLAILVSHPEKGARTMVWER
ncbi:MAG: hypothetical protein J0M04_19460 [Verrucomicrobia bacterium]|nr:hypothetical protein [Verrucomicrobiota bacterium]